MKHEKTLKEVNLDEYEISGFYYIEGTYKFRKYLNIKSKNCSFHQPDLMVIMMNPGSSEPLDQNDNGQIETVAKPDPTQKQIIRVMETGEFKFARVLNLSDLREPESAKFYKKLNLLRNDKIEHSIFSKNRINDFNDLFVQNTPIIYAWGVNKKLMDLAKMAINCSNNQNANGWKKPKFDFAYYHPLPRSNKKQIEWYDIVSEGLIK